MFSRPKILFLVSLLFVALLNPKFNPYLLFKFLSLNVHIGNEHVVYPRSSHTIWEQYKANTSHSTKQQICVVQYHSLYAHIKAKNCE